jgi:hypothetical protein
VGESKERPWGKINRKQPYVVITRDLLRAFFHAKMNVAERALLEYVLEHSWGDATRGKRGGDPWPDALPCEMNLYSLATAWRIDYANLKKARNALVADRILVRSDDRYFINKDVDTWAESRISGDSLEHAAEAIRAGKLAESNVAPLGVNGTPIGVDPTPSRGKPYPQMGVNRTPTDSPHIGTHAELDSEREKRDSRKRDDDSPEDPQLALILKWTLAAIEKAYPGDECLHETVLPKVRNWMALEGYHPADISDAIHGAIARKKNSLGLMAYAKTILDDLRIKRESGRPSPRLSSFEAAPVANKTKLKTYLEPIERPTPPGPDPKGQTR